MTNELDELRAAVCAIGIVGKIDGQDVVYRDSVIDMIDRRRARQAPAAVNIRVFGAVGDGKTDDSAAFQRAINSVISPALVEVSRLAEEAKRLAPLAAAYYHDRLHQGDPFDELFVAIDRLASMASTPVGEVPAGAFGECQFCKSAIRGVHTQACRDRAAPSEPEAQKAAAWEPEMRELIAKLRGGDWSLRSPDELACMIADMLERAIPRIASPSPAASMEVQGLTDAEIDEAHQRGLVTFALAEGTSEAHAPYMRADTRAIADWRHIYAQAVTRALAAKNGWRLGEGRD